MSLSGIAAREYLSHSLPTYVFVFSEKGGQPLEKLGAEESKAILNKVYKLFRAVYGGFGGGSGKGESRWEEYTCDREGRRYSIQETLLKCRIPPQEWGTLDVDALCYWDKILGPKLPEHGLSFVYSPGSSFAESTVGGWYRVNSVVVVSCSPDGEVVGFAIGRYCETPEEALDFLLGQLGIPSPEEIHGEQLNQVKKALLEACNKNEMFGKRGIPILGDMATRTRGSLRLPLMLMSRLADAVEKEWGLGPDWKTEGVCVFCTIAGSSTYNFFRKPRWQGKGIADFPVGGNRYIFTVPIRVVLGLLERGK